MKFESVRLDQAKGRILGHNVAGDGGRRALRKGKALSAADVEALRELGRESVYVARMEHGDVGEDEAARRIATEAAGDEVRLSGARTGRVNLYAESLGLLRLDLARLAALNGCDGVTLATRPSNSAVRPDQMVATLKILPYALPAETVIRAVEIAGGVSSLVGVTPLEERRAGLILSGSPSAEERVVRGFRGSLGARLAALRCTLAEVDYVPLEDPEGERHLAAALRRQREAGLDLLILAGETAIMDRYDIAPRAVERAGGRIECFGAPVDPGNLLLLAELGGVPVLGAPGCSRSPKKNIVDLVLPRLLAGDHLTRADITALGHGGLLDDVPERPLPRSWVT